MEPYQAKPVTRQTEAEPKEAETQAKPRIRRPEVTLKTWRAMVGAAGSLDQGGDGGLASLGVDSATKKGKGSPTEQEEWRDKALPEEWMSVVKPER